MPVRLVFVAGARPNFMKVAPLIESLRGDAAFEVRLVHTGQHYDDSMSGRFLRELGFPEPDYHLGAGSGSHARQTATVMERLEPVLEQEQPQGVVAGDVNSTLAGALTAKKLGLTVVHVEAGCAALTAQCRRRSTALSPRRLRICCWFLSKAAWTTCRGREFPEKGSNWSGT